jgi:hypothetical protein
MLHFQLQNEYLKGVLDGNITEILNILESQKLDLTDLRIQQGLTADLVADSQIDIIGKIIVLKASKGALSPLQPKKYVFRNPKRIPSKIRPLFVFKRTANDINSTGGLRFSR